MVLTGNWNEIFVVHLPLLEKVIRPVIVYLALVTLLRVFGKRELAQLNPFDLVVLLSIANTVQNAIIGNDNSLTGGLIGAFCLLLVNYLVVRFVFRHRRLDELLAGQPTVLIHEGQIRRRALASELMTESELLAAVRRQGFFHLREIKNCQLEPGGAFVIEGKSPREQEAANHAILSAIEKLQAEVQALREERKGRNS